MSKNLIPKIVDLLEQEQKPLDINFVARRLGVHWATVIKALFDCMLDQLSERHRAVLLEMPVVPLSTSKGILLTPKSMLARDLRS